jgi:hypothetical protein
LNLQPSIVILIIISVVVFEQPVRLTTQLMGTIQALKEVYLPESGLWLADYPYCARNIFVNISMEIERCRQAEADAEADTAAHARVA